ncbi:lactonase family protein [Clostridium sp. cel8]|jgi:6-phosphogluconolactonase|uniref:lactonase family protein n=1 Tax=Clostridium sp. cel8 TaxID=2663123 RepID=UPI0015F3EAD4|nr:lactonase family protein [Clostridium sp. cel8]MBA5850794.1 lactonase family protein [Clostridium sp. cel8]
MANANKKLMGYIGTYTTGESKGIYKFKLNVSNGKIEDVDLAAHIENPTYLCIDNDNKYLYSVAKSCKRGGVASFLIENSTGKLKFLNSQLSTGKPPCYVSIDNNRKYLFSANYHKGNIETFPIDEDGSLKLRTSVVIHKGSGPHKNQESAHLHYVSPTPDQKNLYAIDLGCDTLSVYNIENGILKENRKALFKFQPGSGPRHLVVHPKLNYIYVITELTSEIVVLKYNEINSEFEFIQKVSTLPENYTESSAGGAIHISYDGKYLYASNRGHDSIAVFEINTCSGKVKPIQYISTYGSFPRDFEIDPTGEFIVAANQNSNNIVLFKRDVENGKLDLIDKNISVPNPVCIKFIYE